MEIQLTIPSPAITTTPYTTAPSTPNCFPNFYYSAPTSPIRASFQDDDDDFAFDFSGQLELPSISAADELFHCGQIKIIKPLSNDQPESPTSRLTQAFIKKSSDSFTLTFDRTHGQQTPSTQSYLPKRGRETTTGTTRTRDKVSRSSSPFRISDILSEDDNNQKNLNSLTWYNKWNLKNLLLFRSTSEGSARRRKDPVNKYSRIRKGDEDEKNSSFQSADSCSTVVGSNRRVVRKISAHEIHYTVNRAVAEEMRRKTYLPYKSGLLGCLGFRNNASAGGVHEISRGITSIMKQGRN